MPRRDRAESLTKRFGDATAVDGIELDIARGRVLLAGRPLGLRQDDDPADDRRLRAARPAARSCSTAPTSAATPPHKRNVNTVFQSYALFPHLPWPTTSRSG